MGIRKLLVEPSIVVENISENHSKYELIEKAVFS